MQVTQLAGLARLLEALRGVLADRLQHPEALVSVAKQALVEERLEGVKVGLADLFCGVEGAAPAEDGEAGEELLLVLVQQVVAPLDRRPQRLLAGVGAAAGLQQIEALREPLEQLLGGERADACGGELEREGEVVE